MGTKFWVIRFLQVWGFAFLGILGGQLLIGRGGEQALTQALVWAPITAAVFVATRLYHIRRGRRCELCNDMPDSSPESD